MASGIQADSNLFIANLGIIHLMNIALVGHVCIDENVSENVSYVSWGSALIYIATYYRNHTEDTVSLIAPYGRDFLPYANNVHMVNDAQGEHTLIYKNTSNHGRRIQYCENAEYAKPLPPDDVIKRAITQADIVIFAPLLPNYSIAYVTELLSAKRDNCLTALLPQGYFRHIAGDGRVLHRDFDEASELLPLFDMMIFSEDDAPKAVTILQSWAKQNSGMKIIMTQGDKGASWVRERDVLHVGTKPVPKKEIVDSVGCGDTFSAAAIRNYFYSKDTQAAINAGNEAASDKLRHVSSLGAKPDS
jgi:sugar/nucleoside kinase (ribokinase family)